LLQGHLFEAKNHNLEIPSKDGRSKKNRYNYCTIAFFLGPIIAWLKPYRLAAFFYTSKYLTISKDYLHFFIINEIGMESAVAMLMAFIQQEHFFI